MTGSFAKPSSKLHWIKTCDGVWVDRDAFYCIRLRRAGHHPYTNFDLLDIYEARETYPRCTVDLVGIAGSLAKAKTLCQAHADKLFSQEAA